MSIVLKDDVLRNGNEKKVAQAQRLPSVWTGLPVGPEQLTANEAIAQIASWLRRLVDPDQVVELRALRVSDGRTSVTRSGFFDYDHLQEMAKTAIWLTSSSEGVYFTLNPLDRALLARRCNRDDRAESGELTCDANVLCRRWLLLDADPKRLSGVSSTDEEKALARALLTRLRDDLTGEGWPLPVLADSGNGYHLLYRIEQPVDDGDFVKRVLAA